MKRVLFALLFMASVVSAQQPVEALTIHNIPARFDSIKIVSASTDLDSLLLMLPTQYAGMSLDTLGDETVSTAFTRGNPVVWDGIMEVDFWIVNTDLVTDSLEIKVFAVDHGGNVLNNDYIWLQFATPPSFSTGQKILSWTDGVHYRAKITSAFGIGTYALLFIIDPNDEIAHTGDGFIEINY